MVCKVGMNLSKMLPHIKLADFLLDWDWVQMGFLCVWSWWMCIPIFVLLCASRRRGITIGGTTEPAGHDYAQWQHRSFQDNSLWNPERFGRDRKLYEEVMRTWCFAAKDLNWPLHCGQQVWCRIKISITFHLQGQRMILSDCEVDGVKSVRGDNVSTKIRNISKWRQKAKWPT